MRFMPPPTVRKVLLSVRIESPSVCPLVNLEILPVVPPTGLLVLTAIVISFGVIAFTIVLFERAHAAIGTDDVDAMRETTNQPKH